MKIRLLTILLAVSTGLFGQIDQVGKDGDNQVWLTSSFYLDKYYDWFALYGKAEFRFGDDASSLYVKIGELMLNFMPTKWLTISPGYRNFVTRLSYSHWKTVPTPMLDIFFHWAAKDNITLNQRNRFQYNLLPESRDVFLYRNRFQIIFNGKLFGKTIKPFISEEMFFLQYRGFDQNRFILGLKIPLSKHFDVTPSYQLRNIKRHDFWRYQNDFCLDFRTNF